MYLFQKHYLITISIGVVSSLAGIEKILSNEEEIFLT